MATDKKTHGPSNDTHQAQERVLKRSGDDGASQNHTPRWAEWRDIPIFPLYEVVALSCNVEPEAITPTGEYHLPDLDIFHDRLKIAERNFPPKRYPDGVPLTDFMKWVLSLGKRPLWTDLPREFRELVPETPASTDAMKATAEDKPLGTREREILLKIILGLAKAHEIPLDHSWVAAGRIARLVKAAGHRVGKSTIFKHLKIAARLPDSDKN